MLSEHENLEVRIDRLTEWLREVSPISEEHPLHGKRIVPRFLVDPAFITEVVRNLCPSSFTSEVPQWEAAARCLQDAFQKSHEKDIGAQEMLERAIRTEDMEPLENVVWLWQHILCYATICDAKERHISDMISLPTELGEAITQMIGEVAMLPCPSPTMSPEMSAPSSPRSRVMEEDGGLCEAFGTVASDPLVAPGAQDVKDYEHVKQQRDALAKKYKKLQLQLDYQAAQTEKAGIVNRRSSLVLDAEFESFEQSWNLEKQLKEKDEVIKKMHEQVLSGRRAQDDLNRLSEEIDSARLREVEFETLKSKYDRNLQRLEEMGDLKVQLKAVQEKNLVMQRERDALSHEFEQLRATESQCSNWRTKTRDLEVECANNQVKVREADGRVHSMENQCQKLLGEKTSLERQLQELHSRVSALIGQGSLDEGASSSGMGVVEEQMGELRETIQTLRARIAVLEQKLSAAAPERAAELAVEVEHLRDLKQHFQDESASLAERLIIETANLRSREADCAAFEAHDLQIMQRTAVLEEEGIQQRKELEVAALALTEEVTMRESFEADLASSRKICEVAETLMRSEATALAEAHSGLLETEVAGEREKRALELADCRKARAEGRLVVQSRELAEAMADSRTHQEAEEELRAKLHAYSAQLEAAEHQCAQLQDDAEEVNILRRERSGLLTNSANLQQSEERLQQEVHELKEQTCANAALAADCESRKASHAIEIEKLQLQLKMNSYQKDVALRCTAGMAERDSRWLQQYEDSKAKLRDWEQELDGRVQHIRQLQEQLAISENQNEQLRLLAQRLAPAELDALDGACLQAPLSEGTLARRTPACTRLAGLREENARLRAARSDQRARSATETQDLVQVHAKLQVMDGSEAEACAESLASPCVTDGAVCALDARAQGSGTRALGMKENRHAMSTGLRGSIVKKPKTDGCSSIADGVAERRLGADRPMQPNSSLAWPSACNSAEECPTQ